MRTTRLLLPLTITLAALSAAPGHAAEPAAPPPAAKAPAEPDPLMGHVRFVAGHKWLHGDWYPAHDQVELALEGSFGFRRGLVAAADVYVSRVVSPTDYGGRPVDASGSTAELCLGFRRIYGRSWFRPYTGYGLAFIRSSLQTEARSRQTSAIGYWFSGGIAFRLWNRVDLGWAFRYSRALAPTDSLPVDIGGLHIGFTVGVVFVID